MNSRITAAWRSHRTRGASLLLLLHNHAQRQPAMQFAAPLMPYMHPQTKRSRCRNGNNVQFAWAERWMVARHTALKHAQCSCGQAAGLGGECKPVNEMQHVVQQSRGTT